MFFTINLPEKIITDLNVIFKKEKFIGNQCLEYCTTVNGFQTNSIHKNLKYKDLLVNLLSYLPIKNLTYRWFHFIEYDKFGWQEEHDHSKTESYSFIVYLTTCTKGGKTIFRTENNQLIDCLPVKGKLIFFPAHTKHWAEKVIDPKKVAVGGLLVSN